MYVQCMVHSRYDQCMPISKYCVQCASPKSSHTIEIAFLINKNSWANTITGRPKLTVRYKLLNLMQKLEMVCFGLESIFVKSTYCIVHTFRTRYAFCNYMHRYCFTAQGFPASVKHSLKTPCPGCSTYFPQYLLFFKDCNPI